MQAKQVLLHLASHMICSKLFTIVLASLLFPLQRSVVTDIGALYGLFNCTTAGNYHGSCKNQSWRDGDIACSVVAPAFSTSHLHSSALQSHGRVG